MSSPQKDWIYLHIYAKNIDKNCLGENPHIMETKRDFLPSSHAGLGEELRFQSKACGLAMLSPVWGPASPQDRAWAVSWWDLQRGEWVRLGRWLFEVSVILSLSIHCVLFFLRALGIFFFFLSINHSLLEVHIFFFKSIFLRILC